MVQAAEFSVPDGEIRKTESAACFLVPQLRCHTFSLKGRQRGVIICRARAHAPGSRPSATKALASAHCG